MILRITLIMQRSGENRRLQSETFNLDPPVRSLVVSLFPLPTYPIGKALETSCDESPPAKS